jgi:hypothetical protein
VIASCFICCVLAQLNFTIVENSSCVKIIYRENELYFKRLKSFVSNNVVLLFSSHAPLNPYSSILGPGVFDIGPTVGLHYFPTPEPADV